MFQPYNFLSLVEHYSLFCKLCCLYNTNDDVTNFQPYDFLSLIPVIEGAGGVITDWKGNHLNWEASSDTPVTSMSLCARFASHVPLTSFDSIQGIRIKIIYFEFSFLMRHITLDNQCVSFFCVFFSFFCISRF